MTDQQAVDKAVKNGSQKTLGAASKEGYDDC